MATENYNNTRNEAQKRSRSYPDKLVWLYQFGADTYGFRFSELPAGEQGTLLEVWRKGQRISQSEAYAVMRRRLVSSIKDALTRDRYVCVTDQQVAVMYGTRRVIKARVRKDVLEVRLMTDKWVEIAPRESSIEIQ